jgi:hypothetical protein
MMGRQYKDCPSHESVNEGRRRSACSVTAITPAQSTNKSRSSTVSAGALLFLSTIVFFGDNELLYAECSTKEGSLNINGGITQFNDFSDNKRNTTTAMQNYNSRGRVSSWGHT